VKGSTMNPVLAWDVILPRGLAFVAVGLLMNVFGRRVLSKKYNEELDGSPMWLWYTNPVIQMVIIPVLCAVAIAERSIPIFDQWLIADQAHLGIWDVDLSLVLFAYFCKDLTEKQTMLYHLHHVVCAIMSIGALYVPNCGAGIIVGGSILEVGSCCFKLTRFFPFDLWARIIGVVGMTASNLLSFGMLINTIRSKVVPTLILVPYAISITTLLYMRQEFNFREAREFYKDRYLSKKSV